MKKVILPLVALMLSMVACQKENEGILTLEVEEYTSNAKLHLNNNYAVWDNGDEVQVNGTNYTVSVSGTTASISDVEEAANYTAIYPAAWANTTGTTITYPATQTYRANGIDAPMAAYSDGGNLSFKNLGSLLAVNVSGVTKVQKIEVIADGTTAINGTATLDFSGDRPALGTLSSGTNTTTLNCNGTTIAENETKTFYIALPPVTANLTIKVYDDYFCYSRSQSHTEAPSYVANHGYNVPFDASEISSPEQYAPLSTQIWYTATSQISVNWRLTDILGNPIDHTFSDGKGVLTFAGNVTSIPESAFHSTSFTTVTLPYSVTSIGESAFENCRQLTSIDMPGVTSIGRYAFSSCYALTSISLYNVTTLGDNSFQACENLSSVILPINDLESYSGFCAFSGCYNLIDCYYYRNEPDQNLDPGYMNARGTLHVPATSIYAWSTNWWFEGTVVRDL